jgi:hypothetical protein
MPKSSSTAPTTPIPTRPSPGPVNANELAEAAGSEGAVGDPELLVEATIPSEVVGGPPPPGAGVVVGGVVVGGVVVGGVVVGGVVVGGVVVGGVVVEQMLA